MGVVNGIIYEGRVICNISEYRSNYRIFNTDHTPRTLRSITRVHKCTLMRSKKDIKSVSDALFEKHTRALYDMSKEFSYSHNDLRTLLFHNCNCGFWSVCWGLDDTVDYSLDGNIYIIE